MSDDHDKKKGRKKGAIWNHVITDPNGRVFCRHCNELIKIHFGEKVERLRKHFIKSCKNNPFQKNTKEYEDLIEIPVSESKKRALSASRSRGNRAICHHIDLVTSILSATHFDLSNDQIHFLKSQGNTSTNWSNVKLLSSIGMTNFSSLERIKGCHFNGQILMGQFVKQTPIEGGLSLPSGLYNSNFIGTCILSDNCHVSNTSAVINTFVGKSSAISNCGKVICEGHTSYGTMKKVMIGSETSSRVKNGVELSVSSSFYDMFNKTFDIYSIALENSSYNRPITMPTNGILDTTQHAQTSHDTLMASSLSNHPPDPYAFAAMPSFPSQMMNAVPDFASIDVSSMQTSNFEGFPQTDVFVKNKKAVKFNKDDDHIKFDFNIICDDSILCDALLFKNSFLGSYSSISGGSIESSTFMPHSKSISSRISGSILHEYSAVKDGATLENVLLFSQSNITQKAIVTNSIIGPDNTISVGECHHSFLGPFVGFHHQSLLIAAYWPLGRGNVSYGAKIGANHTSRSNDQECLLGEGCFFGLGSMVKFPFNCIRSPYTIFASGTVCPPQKLFFPFSLVLPPCPPLLGSRFQQYSDLNIIKPGWSIYGNAYFIERSILKFTKRRKSSDYKTDFNVFRPSLIDLVRQARNILIKFKETQFHTKNITEAEFNQLFFSTEQVDGVGKCVVKGRDILRAIDSYTTIIRRYSLHGLLYLVATKDFVINRPSTDPLQDNLQGILKDLNADMKDILANLSSMEDHLRGNRGSRVVSSKTQPSSHPISSGFASDSHPSTGLTQNSSNNQMQSMASNSAAVAAAILGMAQNQEFYGIPVSSSIVNNNRPSNSNNNLSSLSNIQRTDTQNSSSNRNPHSSSSNGPLGSMHSNDQTIGFVGDEMMLNVGNINQNSRAEHPSHLQGSHHHHDYMTSYSASPGNPFNMNNSQVTNLHPSESIPSHPMMSIQSFAPNALQFWQNSQNLLTPTSKKLGKGSYINDAPPSFLLTDSYNPKVKAHQIKILSEEFPMFDIAKYLTQVKNRPNVENVSHQVNNLLQYFISLEQENFENVVSSKQKDEDRQYEVISSDLSGQKDPRESSSTSNAKIPNVADLSDETIMIAKWRLNELKNCVHQLQSRALI